MNLLKTLSAASSKAATPALGREITQDALKGGQIKILNNQAVIYGDGATELIRNGYLMNSDLYAIIQYQVKKALRAKYYNYEVKDEKALSDYIMLKGPGANEASLKEARTIQSKALVDTNQTQINKLLSRPNDQQSFTALAEMAYTYKLLTGERMIQKISGLYPVSQYYILPPNQMEVHAGERYLEVSKYTYIPTKKDFTPEEIIFSKLFHPSLNGYGEELRGLSPLKVLAMLIQKSNEGQLSGIRQYQNGGPPGILSLTDDQAPLDEAQARQFEATLSRKGGSNNRGRVNVTGMKADWVEMGLSPVNLDILKSLVSDLQGMCRAYGLDSKLFNDSNASTFNNVVEAGKAAIVNAIIPLVEDFGSDLNTLIEPYNVGGKKYFIDADVTHFPELADDLDKIADRMNKFGATENEKREAQHYPRIENPSMDEPWFDNNRTPLSQFGVDPAGTGAANTGTY